MEIAVLTLLTVAVLAFANGGNDVSKGVATLTGSGRAPYRRAIVWGTGWTAAGGCAAVAISAGLGQAFTTALVDAGVLQLRAFPLAVGAGASAWVLLASRIGMPVSTTHALTGAIMGVALTSGGPESVRWPLLLSTIAAPLALSPLAAAALSYLARPLAARLQPACVCVADGAALAFDAGQRAVALPQPAVIAAAAGCDPAAPGWRLLPGDLLHWGASAALSFARGVNDAPKMAAVALLVLPAQAAGLGVAFVVTAVAMTAGSYLAGMRVTRTLGERVTHMDEGSGLASALVAAGLVLLASFHTLPVSTTHVSAGAIVGAGLRQEGSAVHWSTVASFLAAWVVTLPAAAVLAGVTAWLISLM